MNERTGFSFSTAMLDRSADTLCRHPRLAIRANTESATDFLVDCRLALVEGQD